MSGDEMRWEPTASHLTAAQIEALDKIHGRYGGAEWHPRDFWHPFDLPEGWVSGWVMRRTPRGRVERAIYIGVDPDGGISS
jgi:hypothetical protein